MPCSQSKTCQLVDLHIHILPGMDDGPGSPAEALEMARRAGAEGIGAVVATPHVITGLYPNTREKILESVEYFRDLLREKQLPLSVFPGAEYRLEPDLPERLARGELLTLNDTGRYLLVELPSSLIPPYTGRVIYELLLQGVIPVIAHPERNLALAKEPSLLYELVAKGALSQVTAGSLTGMFGSGAALTAQLFLAHGCAHFLASDAHSPHGRAPVLAEALEAATRLLGKDGAGRLASGNPLKAVRGTGVDTAGLKEIRIPRQGFLRKLFSR